MKRWQLLAAILLAVVLVAALVLYLVKFKRPEPAPPVKPLSDIPMADVRSLAVRGADGAECSLERDGQGNWQIVAPVPRAADQEMVFWFLEDLLGAETSNAAPAAEVDLVHMGLEPPTATISLGLRGGETRTLQVGRYAPRSRAYFVRMADHVYLFPEYVIYRAMAFMSAPPVLVEPTPTGVR